MPDSVQSGTTRDLKRLNHELSVLNAIARELNRSVDLGEALRFTLSRVAELLGLDTGWIWLIGESSPEPYLAATLNLPPALANDPRRMDGSGYCYCLYTYKKGDLEGAANVNVLTCSRLSGLVDGTGGLQYHASIPLYAGEKKLGVMNVAAPSGAASLPKTSNSSTLSATSLVSPSNAPASSPAAQRSGPSKNATASRENFTTPSPRV